MSTVAMPKSQSVLYTRLEGFCATKKRRGPAQFVENEWTDPHVDNVMAGQNSITFPRGIPPTGHTSTEPVRVVSVDGPRDLRRFIRLPWSVYADDPTWIPPLLAERR